MKEINIEQIIEVIFMDLRKNKTAPIPTEEDLQNSINKVKTMYSAIGRVITDKEKKYIADVIIARTAITMDCGTQIIDYSTYKPWLHMRKSKIDEYYWNRYKQYLLEEKHWNSDVVDTLDKVGDEILDLLGDPEETGRWSRKGLILGDIQSGKTSNYIALCNKAADAGYKVIILLTGTLEALRKQTQERIDAGFVGLNSRNVLDRKLEKKYVGVGILDKRRAAYPFTDISNDFDIKKLQSLNFTLKGLNEPVVLVVKKNTSVLKNLCNWLKTSNIDAEGEVIDLPLLLIDDEADNASVNTKKDDQDPTAINDGIRNILRLFNRDTYVAVTATPFANIFINPETKDESLNDDLFPSDFIYSLSPPSHYIGSNKIFGDDSEYSDCLETIDDADGVFSSKDKSSHIVSGLPTSLVKAVNYFMLCNVISDLNGKKCDHRSMLVNVSQYTFVQEQTFDMIDNYVDKIQKEVKHYSKQAFEIAIKNGVISTLYDVWIEYKMEQKSNLKWDSIQKNLSESITPIKVTMINTKTKSRGLERLDYEPYDESGLRIIAVGGNSLSRGITLEGLCVSYFYRESKMYDTLLQMGRWFGYRPGYDGIFKVWMTERTKEWYAFITKACEELRSEIAYMNKLQQTPNDFGLKVREHPDTLMITASNKMRTAKPFESWISLSGRLVETPRLITRMLDYNLKITSEFLSKVITNCVKDEKKSEHLYIDVPKQMVADYVKSFASHRRHLIFRANEIGEYIEKSKAFDKWCVLIANGRDFDNEITIAGVLFRKSLRKMLIDNDCIQISGQKSRIGSVGTTKITLEENVIKNVIENYKREHNGTANVPDHEFLKHAEKPLIIIYLMACNQENSAPKDLAQKIDGKVVVGLGIGFPKIADEEEEKIYYKVNMVEYKNLFGEEIDLEGDEDED